MLGTGPMSVHQALLLRPLTDDLSYFPHTRALTDQEATLPAAVGSSPSSEIGSSS